MIGSGVVADVIQIRDSFGVAWTFAVVLALIVLYLLYIHFRNKAHDVQIKTDKASETLELLRRSILLDSGQSISIVDLAELVEKLMVEFKSNCDGCVTHRKDVTELTKTFNDLRKDVESIVIEGRQSRQTLHDNLNMIAGRLDKIASEMLSTLRLAFKLDPKHKED